MAGRLMRGVVFGLLAIVPSCFEQRTKADKKEGLVVINVLDKELYDDCHIAGSINVPCTEYAKIESLVDKNAEVVLYCSNYNCTSSEYVAKKLCQKGFCNVKVYEAGMAEWFQEGLPCEGPHAKAYLKKPCKRIDHDDAESQILLVGTDELAKKMNIRS